MIQHTIDLSKLTPPQVDAYCALVRALAPADSGAARMVVAGAHTATLPPQGAAVTIATVVTDFTMMGADELDARMTFGEAKPAAILADEYGRRTLVGAEANAEAPTGALPSQGAAGIDFSSRRGRVAEPESEFLTSEIAMARRMATIDAMAGAPAEVQYGESVTLQNGGEVTLHAGPRPDVNEPTDAGMPSTLAEVDLHGVPFDAAYCARAAAPFYGSGKESGQWKKKVGVTKSDYDVWYAAARAALAPAATHSEDGESNDAPFDMGRAFASAAASSTSVAQAGAALVSALQPQAAPPMQTAGEFMRWVSEATVAGTLTQPQIDDAWVRLGLGYADIMPPTPPERVAANVQALVAELS